MNGSRKRFLAVAAEHRQGVPQQSPSDAELAVGQMVVLQGLNNAEFNGKRGRIVCESENGRWGVELDGADAGSRPMSFKAQNIQLARLPDSEEMVPDRDALFTIRTNHIRQNPQYTLAALQQGVYVIGMKDQFNCHDLPQHPLNDRTQYIVDEMGFVLLDRTAGPAVSSKSVDNFGPYFIEQYILMDALSKQELAQNVLDYYVNHKQKLQDSLSSYSEEQGKGFICWRFLMKEAGKGKACGSPVLRALARKKAAGFSPREPQPTAPPSSLLGRMVSCVSSLLQQ